MEDLGSHVRLPWARLAAEFVVIVVGVLVALGVDSASSARDEALRKAAYLVQLRAEVAVTAEDLAAAIAQEEAAIERAERFLESLSAGDLASTDSLQAWTVAIGKSSLFLPTMGTVTALIETGDLRLIRNDRLRSELVRFQQAAEGQRRLADLADASVLRALERIGTRVNLNVIGSPNPERLRFQIDWEALAGDVAFHSEVFHLKNAARNRLSALNGLRRSLERLGVALDRAMIG